MTHSKTWEFSSLAKKHIKEYKKKNDSKSTIRIKELMIDINNNGPLIGEGKPEKLKHHLKGYFSRRIDKTNRLVYKETETGYYVLSCKYHYPKEADI
ncbi:Txe/YoeB family addiction module toxin [Flammeovirga sp. MY04]|uniref:Txe/YoeB family addiction module toxin n=1 Tax=Flammeovirga sp. MY04 TaxID=1191459 RepID=UPI00082667DA|nr:Txe/YoeB family addiction module toxin [Flammeovirga sp. MY04]QJD09373.1 Txe/YoeB family addiction module toxin [Flammeovirga sp. MY04]